MSGDGIDPMQACMLLVLFACLLPCSAGCQSVWTVSDSGGVRQMASNARPITDARSRLRLVRVRGEGRTLSLAAWVAWYLACLMHCDSGMDKSSVSPIIKAPSLLTY